MLLFRSNVRALLPSPTTGPLGHRRFQLRWLSRTVLKEIIVAETPTAKKLQATGTWAEKVKGKKKSTIQVDPNRINLVSERLCDDIISYYGSTLHRHKGCDIIDLFPGVGLWSKKLSDLLQPRSHILLEPDDKFYRPFLEPLLAKPNTVLLPKSGISWKDLDEVLNPTILPHQTEIPRTLSELPQRNDTLLVTANIALFPKRKYASFASVSSLVVYQFIDAIRSSSLFQKYGLVRMLLWMPPDEVEHILPHVIQLRRRLAVDTELVTDWVTEVVTDDSMPIHSRNQRDYYMDLESAQNTLDRMRERGVVTPPGRETKLLQEALAMEGQDRVVAGTLAKDAPWYFNSATMAELEQKALDKKEKLEGLDTKAKRLALKKAKTANPQEARRLADLKYRVKLRDTLAESTAELIKELNHIIKMYEAAGTDAKKLEVAQKRDKEWNEKIANTRRSKIHFKTVLDNLRAFRQSPPLLQWDRRPLEPLVARPTEFYPNVPCSLVDIQPSAPSPLLRKIFGEDPRHPAELFDIMQRHLHATGARPVVDCLLRIHPGATQDLVPDSPSLTDIAQGGSPVSGFGAVNARTMTKVQMEELLRAWLRSPFTPKFTELLGSEGGDADGAVVAPGERGGEGAVIEPVDDDEV